MKGIMNLLMDSYYSSKTVIIISTPSLCHFFRITNVWKSLYEILILPLARMFEKRQKNIN